MQRESPADLLMGLGKLLAKEGLQAQILQEALVYTFRFPL